MKEAKEMSAKEIVYGIIGIVIIIAVVLLVWYLATNNKSDSENKTASQNATQEQSKQTNQTDEPIEIAKDSLSMTGKEFANKYSGKTISFDGLITGTERVSGAKYPHTGLLLGNDISGMFSDGSVFVITAMTQTFSNELSEFAQPNSSPSETGNYPKVHVTAKVNAFDESHSWIELDPISNIDGKSPSIVTRN